MTITKETALRYHEKGRPGKIEVIPTKPTSSQLDLSLAYTPGVAVPVLEIDEDANNISVHHNLFAHNGDRNPLFKDNTSGEFINNVVYNWCSHATYFAAGGSKPIYAHVI